MSASSPAITATQRFTLERPCPICGGHPRLPYGQGIRCHGYLSDDGAHAFCAREQHAGNLPLTVNGLYRHGLRGECQCGQRHDALMSPLPKKRRPKTSDAPAPEVVATTSWTIAVIDGEPIEHRRVDYADGSKAYPWYRGGTPGLRGQSPKQLPLYGSESLQPGGTCILVEGEKCADALAPIASELGIVVVATTCGAPQYPTEEVLRDLLNQRHVIFWADNDDPGTVQANSIATFLLRQQDAPTISAIRWRKAPPAGDAADWISGGGDADGLRVLIEQALPVGRQDDRPAESASLEQIAPVPSNSLSAASRLHVVSLADVEPKPVDWLWPGWLAKGKLHLLAGQAGDGKSTIAAAIAAIGSVGGIWPDGTPAPLFRTMFVLGEDAIDDTLRPRLDLHGADVSNVLAVEHAIDEEGRERTFDVARHLRDLEAVITDSGIDVVFIDPLTHVMPGSDRNSEGAVRDLLTPLAKMAERTGCAIVGIAHVGKPNGTSRTPQQKVLGATAYVAIARTVLMTTPTPNGGMALAVAKSNLAEKPPALLWERAANGEIEWIGIADESLDELMANAVPARPRQNATEFLTEYLATGMKPAQEVEAEAKARGISKRTLDRSKPLAGVESFRPPHIKNGPSYWRLIPDPAEPTEGCQSIYKDWQPSVSGNVPEE